SFNCELVFDRMIVGQITENINQLIASPLFHRDQKLNLLNQYVLHKLVYPLQAAPLRKIPPEDVEIIDRAIRSSIKVIIGLPKSTLSEMIYSPPKYQEISRRNL